MVKGIVAVILNENGQTMAEASDFGTSTSAGYKKLDAQRSRVSFKLGKALLDNLCSPYMFPFYSEYTMKELIWKIQRGEGGSLKYHEFLVGYDEE